MKLRVGTRGSKLSLIQTEGIIKRLKQSLQNLEVEVIIIKTAGDELPHRPLEDFSEKGIFERKVDLAVLKKEVDFAVHSLKDVPTSLLEGLTITSVPRRGSPYDVLISRDGSRLDELPTGAVVGTGSLRREAQLHFVRPDLKVMPIRGNVDTRLRKLRMGRYDAIIVAEAGLKRLGVRPKVERLPLKAFIPAPGQGALGLVTRQDDEEVMEVLKKVDHSPSRAAVVAERSLVRELKGGCKNPVGAIGQVKEDRLTLTACLLHPHKRVRIRASEIGSMDAPEELGIRVAKKMLRMGAMDIIEEWREIHGDW